MNSITSSSSSSSLFLSLSPTPQILIKVQTKLIPDSFLILNLSVTKLSSSKMHPQILEFIRLGITSSEIFLIFLEENSDKILNESTQIIQELNTRASKISNIKANWNLFGKNISNILREVAGFNENDAEALGILKELQIARLLGFCSIGTLSRVQRLLSTYGFPTRMDILESIVQLPLINNHRRKLVIISQIGSFQLISISNIFIRQVLESGICVVPSGRIFGTVCVPGSKSISNRVLLLAALGQGSCEIGGLLDSDDIQCMLRALKILSVDFKWIENGSKLIVEGTGGNFTEVNSGTEFYLKNSGTASRFLTSTATIIPIKKSGNDGKKDGLILTGNDRMMERPIGPLVEALNSNGCKIEYLKSERCLPILVQNTGIFGGVLKLEAEVSSQFVSSILMVAPYAKSPLTLKLAEETPTSLPYILMTMDLMKSFGIQVHFDNVNEFKIEIGVYSNPCKWNVEPDASSSTYILALAAITGGETTVRHLGSNSLQGDAQFFKVLELMGCKVEQTQEKTSVRGPDPPQKLQAVNLNMENLTDSFMTVAVLAAVANGSTRITGISNQRVKECNRIQVMVTELSKIGVECGELDDGIWINGVEDISKLKTPVYIQCHDDHRIALSFAVLGSKVPGIIITDKECISKTYPGFWDDLHSIGVGLNPGSQSSTNHNNLLTPTVFLVGMRGCGKSTFGRLAGAALGLNFLCMDDVMESDFGISITSFVSKYGWEAFRSTEENLLKRIKENVKYGTIVSCGGGIVESLNNLQILSCNDSVVVHIERDFEEVKIALEGDRIRAPLPQDLDTIWNRRQPRFQKCSKFHFKFSVKDENWEKTTEEFIQLLQNITQN